MDAPWASSIARSNEGGSDSFMIVAAWFEQMRRFIRTELFIFSCSGITSGE